MDFESAATEKAAPASGSLRENIVQSRTVKTMPVSFATDIRPLFREDDVDTMKQFGLDLSSYAHVKDKAQLIYGTLEDGSMPCDGAWPKEQVALFKRWMDEGMAA